MNKEQIKKSIEILDIVCEEGLITPDRVYRMFDSKKYAESICTILKSMGSGNIVFAGGLAGFHMNNNSLNIKNELKQELLSLIKHESNEKLKVENLKLQNESLIYQKTIRTQNEEISDLTKTNLILKNKQLKRYVIYSVMSFIVGLIVSNYAMIRTILKQAWQVIVQ